MNSHNAQSLASDKLIFEEQEDLFNPTYFEQDFNDIFNNNQSLNNSFYFDIDLPGNLNEDVQDLKTPQIFNFNKKESDVFFDSSKAVADFQLSSDSFHFHFDKHSNDISVQQEILPRVGRTENRILFMAETEQDMHIDRKPSYESSVAFKSTSHSNIVDSQFKRNEAAQENSPKITFEEGSNKTCSSPKNLTNTLQKNNQSKSLIKNTPTVGDVDLSIRRDVVNKTVLRIMRRFYMQKFKEIFPDKFKSKESKSNWYFTYVKKLVIKIFGKDHPELRMLQIYIASIINPKHMTSLNIQETGLNKEQFLAFHSTIYKYSHTRLTSLFKVHALKEIYAYFFNCPLDQILKSETSVSKNFTLYSKAFNDFYNVLEGTDEVITLTTN